MAFRSARRIHRARALILGAATLATLATAAALVPGLATASPATRPVSRSAKPTPSISSVQHRLGQLALRNTQLVEKYDQARILVAARDKAATVAGAKAVAAHATYTRTHSEFVQLVQAQYEDESFGATGALLASNSKANYLDRLNTMDMMSTRIAEIVSSVHASQVAAAAAATTAQSMLVQARTQRNALAAEKKSVAQQIDRYRTLLATLNSAQQAAYQRAMNRAVSEHKLQSIKKANSTTTTSSKKSSKTGSTKSSTAQLSAAGSGAARKAVAFALAQVGKPYSYGASGPGSYDCSGLTMEAWAHAGVSLPHSAADQYNYGHHVSRDDLQPGDLLFFYEPIGHVTIYAGDGYMVTAPETGEDVSVVPLAGYSAPYVGATRLT